MYPSVDQHQSAVRRSFVREYPGKKCEIGVGTECVTSSSRSEKWATLIDKLAKLYFLYRHVFILGLFRPSCAHHHLLLRHIRITFLENMSK